MMCHSGTQDSYLGNEDGNSLTADLGVTYGADQPGSIQLTTTYNGTSDVAIAAGLAVQDNVGNLMTVDGINLVYAFDSGDLIAIMDPAQSNEDDFDASHVAFRVSVDETASTYTVTIEDGVDGAPTVIPIGLTGGDLQGGNPLIFQKDVNLDNDADIELRLTATAYTEPGNQITTPESVNYNNNGMGVGTGSSIDGAYDGIDNTTVSDVLHLEFTNPEDGDSFVEMSVIEATLKGFSGEVGYWRAITHDQSGNEDVVAEGSFDGSDYTAIDNSFGFVTINAGINFDTIEFLCDNADGNGYIINSISIVNISEAYDRTLTYNFEATDADLDTASGTFDVTFDGDGNISGDSGSEVIKGTSLGNILDGGAGDDTIVFDEADSSVDGGLGIDTLLVADTALDFSSLADGTITNIEKIEMTNGEEQTISLTATDVLDMSSGDSLVITGGTDQANNVDTIELDSSWSQIGTTNTFESGAASITVFDATVDLDSTLIPIDDGGIVI